MSSVGLGGTSLIERLMVKANNSYRIFRVAFGPKIGEERAGKAAPHKGLSESQIKSLPYGTALLAGLAKGKKIARDNATSGVVMVMIGGMPEIWPATALANYNAGKKPYGDLEVRAGSYRQLLKEYASITGVKPMEVIA